MWLRQNLNTRPWLVNTTKNGWSFWSLDTYNRPTGLYILHLDDKNFDNVTVNLQTLEKNSMTYILKQFSSSLTMNMSQQIGPFSLLPWACSIQLHFWMEAHGMTSFMKDHSSIICIFTKHIQYFQSFTIHKIIRVNFEICFEKKNLLQKKFNHNLRMKTPELWHGYHSSKGSSISS